MKLLPRPAARPRPERRLRVVVVGAGFSGIAMALALTRAGHGEELLIVDAAPEFGGTWRDNTYPGCECDIPSPVYSLRDEPHDWPRFYGRQPEILQYLLDVVERHDLRRHARLGTRITHQQWHADSSTWTLHTDDGDTITADVVINAVGPLTEPVIPEIPGAADFAGPAFHSARWREDVDLDGLRIGVIGTGASAVQIIPSIVDDVGHMTVFQRTPSWVVPKVERTFSGPERWVLRTVPGAHRLLREATYQILEQGVWRLMTMDHRVQGLVRAAGRANIRRGIADPDTRRKVTPSLTPGCKRLMFSNAYYPALGRGHVDVETTGIARVTPTGVVLEDGSTVDLDVIIWGTGFDVHQFWLPMTVEGQDGQRLADAWAGGAGAYRCVAAPGFPNSFFLLGPNSGLGHNSVVLMAEAQVDYVMQALDHLRTGEVSWMAPTVEATRRWVAEMDGRHADLVWASGCHSWYLNEDGVNDTLYPGNVGEYRRRMSRFDIERYDVGRRAREAVTPGAARTSPAGSGR